MTSEALNINTTSVVYLTTSREESTLYPIYRWRSIQCSYCLQRSAKDSWREGDDAKVSSILKLKVFVSGLDDISGDEEGGVGKNDEDFDDAAADVFDEDGDVMGLK